MEGEGQQHVEEVAVSSNDPEMQMINNLSLAEIREELESRALEATGLKAVLVQRLKDALDNERKAAEVKRATPSPAASPAAPLGDNTQPKLFVGQVPVGTTEAKLMEVFAPYGNVTEAIVLKDKHTGAHKGCGFVMFATTAECDAAIAGLSEKVTLPTGKREMVVRYAGKPPSATQDQQGDHKLYVGMLSRKTTEEEVRLMFEPYGTIKETFLMKQKDSQQSKGSAFVKFNTREEAQRAINALHERHRDGDAPSNMQVRFAHTKTEKDARQGVSPFPAQMAGMYGGFPYMPLPAPGGAGQWGGLAPQWPQAPGQMPFMPQAPVYGGAPGLGGLGMLPGMVGLGGAALGAGGGKEARGPNGANLFVYGVPDSFGDSDLMALFAGFGNIVSVKVQRDQAGASKGFGFVSFDDPTSASAAIANLDNFVLGNKRLSVRVKTDGAGGSRSGGTGARFSPY